MEFNTNRSIENCAIINKEMSGCVNDFDPDGIIGVNGRVFDEVGVRAVSTSGIRCQLGVSDNSNSGVGRFLEKYEGIESGRRVTERV